MGIDYSYEVYVHRDSARALLETVKTHCFQWRGGFTVVEFPDGTVEMPCTSGFDSGKTIRFGTPAPNRHSLLDLDLSIEFPADAELLNWVDDDPEDLPIDAQGRRLCRVGYIYLTVYDASTFLPDHVSFDFTAAVTGMSLLFVRSSSIRQWFADLTFAHSGPLCLLDLENNGRPAITVGSVDRQRSVDWSGLYL